MPEPSKLVTAIAENNPSAVDRHFADRFRKIVNPAKKDRSAAGMNQTDNRILTMLDQIIERPPALTSEKGAALPPGTLPQTLRQTAEAMDSLEGDLFQRFDALAKRSGEQGVMVPTAPAVARLREIAQSKDILDNIPHVAAEAERQADAWAARAYFTPSEAQAQLKTLNAKLTSHYEARHQDAGALSRVFAPAADELRKTLVSSIETATGPGYGELRRQYGAIASLKDSIAKATQRELQRKYPDLMASLGDLASSSMFLHGIATLNPHAVGAAATTKLSQVLLRHLNDPNRAIKRLFAQRAASKAPPGPLRTGLSFAGQQAPRLAPGLGFEAGKRMPPPGMYYPN